VPPVERPPKPSAAVVAGYVAYASVGWYLSGVGSALPDLEEDLGSAASAYPLFPGAALLAWGLFVARRRGAAAPSAAHRSVIVVGSFGLAAGVLVTGFTRVASVSVAGALAAAVAAAALIRLLPGMFATERPHDTERVMVRGNAWSSLAGITSPLAIGLTIGLGAGWLPGMVVPITIAAVVVAIATRAGSASAPPAVAEPESAGAVPPLSAWWREWTVLTTCIVVEFCFSYFAATFLHDELGLSTAAAAAGGAAWGVGMAGGRFVSSVVPPPRSVVPSAVTIAVGFVLLWAPGIPILAVVGIGLAGVGASPLYPTRATALLARFPGSPDQGSTRGSVASGTALLLAPGLMAGLRAVSDVRTAYLVVPVLLGLLVVLARPIPAGTPLVTVPPVDPVPPA
jgi:hypothetical protein